MAINSLTDADCRRATPNDGKLRKLFDGHGLMLAVLPSGNKVWRMAYRDANGKQQTAVIGPYPLIGLKDARERRDALRLRLLDGEDLKSKSAGKPSITLDEAHEKYWAGRTDTKEGYRKNARSAYEMYMSPTLGKAMVRDITKEQLMEALRPVDQEGKSVYVRRLRMWVSHVVEWSHQHGYCDGNPAAAINPKVAFSRKKAVGFAALPLADVHPFLERMALEEMTQSVLACKLLALTWTRTDELRSMTWDEIEGDLWRVPAHRMKGGREHLVPLSKQAQQLFTELKRRARGSKYVFPNDRTATRPMSENAILYLIHRIGFKGKMTGHGWRKVGSTWANENEYNRDWIEMQLAHVEENEVRGAYNSAEYLKQRRGMMQDYADWLLKEA
ncbi:tyrosine-type recombinase/integrase [Pseudoduganella sp. RAF53_2]|uniref:tyrosine-type recombinase/integrase n=1 Tax=unclassified Pseudoduganella TaxID=2637179 RepID=UPI003F9568AB